MELYIHIPYCVRKCNYCDFLSFPTGECNIENQTAKYIDALCKEIEASAELYSDREITSVFIGGGTPSLLPVTQMRRVLTSLGRWHIAENAEFTVECNPGTVSEEKLRTYREFGVNRLSFGLQSVNDDELKQLGRIHTFEAFKDSYRMARECGFGNINIDLISAIPGQNTSSWEKTLRTVAELKPEHISAYSLIIEEGTPFFEQKDKLKLPDEDTERAIYAMTSDILCEYGFHRYEISNYARDGRECRHNLGYWTGEEYLGLGLGASSYVDNMRYKNTDDVKIYADEGNTIREDVEILERQDLISEFIILHLRLSTGFERQEFVSRFGTDIDEMYGNTIKKYCKLGFMADTEGRIRLTDKGFDISNTIMAEFI